MSDHLRHLNRINDNGPRSLPVNEPQGGAAALIVFAAAAVTMACIGATAWWLL